MSSNRFNLPTPPSPTPITPMVYVKDKIVWQYKVLTRDLAQGPNEDELNILGKDGWELAAVVPHLAVTHFYFKKVKD